MTESNQIPLIATLARAWTETPTLPRTPGLLLGPYYPIPEPAGASSRLWPHSSTPTGTRALLLEGRVVDPCASVIAGARVELWHADPHGRYAHPVAPETWQVMPGFTGYGTTETDANGCFEFDSLVPGPYGDGRTQRAPHLHLQITTQRQRLVTQVFLPYDALRANDHWFRSLRHPERLVASATRDDDEMLRLRWTAVMA
jgi:protocatechuate 3,4-dioxygenase, beta subunit